jgi:hypothetical protein
MPPAPAYSPTPDQNKAIVRIDRFYEVGYQDRRPHEGEWFLCTAAYRGQCEARWNDFEHRMILPISPIRRRDSRNRFQAKIRGRHALFMRNPTKPEVRPATADHEDKENARLTQKALEYQDRRCDVQQKYDEALHWSELCSHGLLWMHWDPNVVVRGPNPLTGQVEEAPLGDIKLEVGSPFELLVADPAIPYIGDQPAIMRCKIVKLDDLKAEYGELAAFITPDSLDDDTHRNARYIAGLAAGGWSTAVTGQQLRATSRGEKSSEDEPNIFDRVVRKEYFEAPCPLYPNGYYAVVAGGVLLKEEFELPEGFGDMGNPYPCIDFPDMLMPGQFWSSTIAAQLLSTERGYNRAMDTIERNFRKAGSEKTVVDRRMKVNNAEITDETNEVITANHLPGIPPIYKLPASPIIADAWRLIDVYRDQYDVISGIYPEAEGASGKSESGFQANLLQEATSAIHQPDINVHTRAKTDLYRKMRRMMKNRYQATRLMSLGGHNSEPEVFEFSASNIDEYADIVVETGSMLPDMKGARLQALLEMFQAGAFGPPNDPNALRQFQKRLEFGRDDESFDPQATHEQNAHLENLRMHRGEDVEPAEFGDNHTLHYQIHVDDLVKARMRKEPFQKRLIRVKHILTHARYQNPQAAMMIAAEYGLPVPPPPGAGLTPMAAQGMQGMPPQGAPMPPGGAPPPQGSVPQGLPGAPPAPMPPPQFSGPQ